MELVGHEGVESDQQYVLYLVPLVLLVGLDTFVPNEFHRLPRYCREFMDIDVVVTCVSPMDKAGFFTFGTVNDFISTAAGIAKG